jgi:hypothetical protein
LLRMVPVSMALRTSAPEFNLTDGLSRLQCFVAALKIVRTVASWQAANPADRAAGEQHGRYSRGSSDRTASSRWARATRWSRPSFRTSRTRWPGTSTRSWTRRPRLGAASTLARVHQGIAGEPTPACRDVTRLLREPSSLPQVLALARDVARALLALHGLRLTARGESARRTSCVTGSHPTNGSCST